MHYLFWMGDGLPPSMLRQPWTLATSELCDALPVLVKQERVTHFNAEIPVERAVSEVVGNNLESEDDVL